MFSLKDPSTTGVACKKAKVNCRLQIYICSAEDAMVDRRMSGAFTQSQPGFLQLRFHPSGDRRELSKREMLQITRLFYYGCILVYSTTTSLLVGVEERISWFSCSNMLSLQSSGSGRNGVGKASPIILVHSSLKAATPAVQLVHWSLVGASGSPGITHINVSLFPHQWLSVPWYQPTPDIN